MRNLSEALRAGYGRMHFLTPACQKIAQIFGFLDIFVLKDFAVYVYAVGHEHRQSLDAFLAGKDIPEIVFTGLGVKWV